jgi:predicted Zn-dependent protease
MKIFARNSDPLKVVTGQRRGFSVKVLHLLFCLILVPAALLLGGCAEVPITHREGLHLVPESQLLTMSFQQYEQVLKTSKLSQDQSRTHMVRTVGEKVAQSAEGFLKDAGHSGKIVDYRWEFNLIEDDKTVNAWCMPGGKVGVYTGILPYAQNETGLAVVLGHEIGHALADHGNERMSQVLLAEMGGMALSVALSQKPSETRDLFMAVFGVGVSVGALLPYSRLHESEADRIGLMLMARAGYDPRESIPFWERMSKERKAKTPEFLSTHPAPESRIENLRNYIPEALPYYKKIR